MSKRMAILSWCASQVQPIPYCTGPCRFGKTPLPRVCGRKCRDCSGMTSEAYLQAAGIHIGLDTGAVARDVKAGKAKFVNRGQMRAGELMMRRDGPVYNGGSDEHIGIFVRYLNNGYMQTWESAGSKNGHGIYDRPVDFWDDGVLYPALDEGSTSPSRPDVPALIPKGDLVAAYMFGGKEHVAWVNPVGVLVHGWLEKIPEDFRSEKVADGCDPTHPVEAIVVEPNKHILVAREAPAKGGGMVFCIAGVGWKVNKIGSPK